MGFILVTVDELLEIQIVRSKWWKKGLFGPDFNIEFSDLFYVAVSFMFSWGVKQNILKMLLFLFFIFYHKAY